MPRETSAGVLVYRRREGEPEFLLVHPGGPYWARKDEAAWSIPKGLVEAGEEPIDAALREVREETTLDDLSFDWGMAFMDTGPYNKGKISRYYIARSKETQVLLPVNPDLGMPEHHEARWVDFAKAVSMVSPRLQPVVQWAYAIINHESADKPG